MEFNQLKTALIKLFKANPEANLKELRKLASAKDVPSVIALVRENWQCLNSRSWEQFQQALISYYKEYEKEFGQQGIFYNTPGTTGLICIDDNADTDCVVVRGNAECAVHGRIHVLVGDQATATVMDHVRCTAHDDASVVARHHSRVMAHDNSVIKAFDMAKVESYGETSICLYDTSVANIHKVRLLSVGTRAKAIRETII